VESYDTSAATLERDGCTYRYKYTSSRPFLSVFGEVDIYRRIYQRDAGGHSIVPLDKRWGMTNEFVTLDVRESILFSVAHNTPEETDAPMAILRSMYYYHDTLKLRTPDLDLKSFSSNY
jgi:hypothetical protein